MKPTNTCVLPVPGCVVMKAWRVMPGRAVVMEAFIRGNPNREFGPGEAMLMCDVGNALALLHTDHTQADSFLSLATTMRKLLCFLVPAETDASTAARPLMWAGHPSNHSVSSSQSRVDASQLAAEIFAPALVNALAALNRTARAVGGGGSSSSSSSGVGNTRKGSRGTQGQVSKHKNIQELKSIQQVQATLCLTLAQVFSWRAGCRTSALCTVMWWTEALRVCQELSSSDLRDVVSPLLTDAAYTQVRSDVGAVWERYAVNHFHGRLTPGCCNLSCSNLDGISESALKTQLCGGCKRARYCCVSCQKAAWLHGGHSAVCGI